MFNLLYFCVPGMDAYIFQGLDLPGVMVETERQGIPFEELLAIPEKDNWKYSDGYSTSCVAFVLEIYKQAGLFGSVADSVQVTEFTVSLKNYHASPCLPCCSSMFSKFVFNCTPQVALKLSSSRSQLLVIIQGQI